MALLWQPLMNNIPIDIVLYFNYLGIILKEHLSWKAHVAMVSGKLSKINGIFNRLKYIYPAQVLLILHSHYLSHTLSMGPWYGAKTVIP